MTPPLALPPVFTLHVLHHGRSLCPFDLDVDGKYRPPGQWPLGHTWISLRDLRANVDACNDPVHELHSVVPYAMCQTCVSNAATYKEQPK